MERKELLERIDILDVSTIEAMSFDVMAMLTEDFKEPLVRALVLQGGGNDDQWKIVKAIMEKYNEWMKDTNPLWEPLTFSETYPEYMMRLKLDVETGYIVTQEGSAPPQRAILKIGPALDHSKMIKHTPSEKIEQTTETGTNKKQLVELQARIEELEAENKDLKEEVSRLQKQLEEKPDGITTTDGKEEMIIELLMPIFFNDEKNVKDFLSMIKDIADTQITDLVHEWSQPKVNKISSKSRNRPLWSVLHAAKLYRATDRNWDTALRKSY